MRWKYHEWLTLDDQEGNNRNDFARINSVVTRRDWEILLKYCNSLWTDQEIIYEIET